MNEATLKQFHTAAVANADEKRIDLWRRAMGGDPLAEHAIEVLILVDDRDKWRALAEKLAPEKTEAIDRAVANEREGCARLARRLVLALLKRPGTPNNETIEREADEVASEIRKRGE